MNQRKRGTYEIEEWNRRSINDILHRSINNDDQEAHSDLRSRQQ